MRDVFIIDGLRTPIGGLGKGLKSVSAINLAAYVIKALLERNDTLKALVEEGILGNTVSAGLGQNPARLALIAGGLAPEIPAFTVNKVCGSGLKAVSLAAQAIICGDADIIIAGGMESASQSPRLVRVGEDISQIQEDRNSSLINDGLWCGMSNVHMGTIAEYTVEKFNISRKEQDEYALSSHKKACFAQEQGFFKREIVPVKTSEDKIVDTDEKPRKNTSMEKLARIPPAFKVNGTVTAGNSPAPADGAAALIIASDEAIKKNALKPIARVLGYVSVAVEPKEVFSAAAIAIEKCLKKCSLKISDIDLFEINEAFSVQAILTKRLLKLDEKKMNVFGGTIALGHPLGASGARGLITLINALKIQNKKIGITSICLGGGCAVALAVDVLS